MVAFETHPLLLASARHIHADDDDHDDTVPIYLRMLMTHLGYSNFLFSCWQQHAVPISTQCSEEVVKLSKSGHCAHLLRSAAVHEFFILFAQFISDLQRYYSLGYLGAPLCILSSSVTSLGLPRANDPNGGPIYEPDVQYFMYSASYRSTHETTTRLGCVALINSQLDNFYETITERSPLLCYHSSQHASSQCSCTGLLVGCWLMASGNQ